MYSIQSRRLSFQRSGSLVGFLLSPDVSDSPPQSPHFTFLFPFSFTFLFLSGRTFCAYRCPLLSAAPPNISVRRSWFNRFEQNYWVATYETFLRINNNSFNSSRLIQVLFTWTVLLYSGVETTCKLVSVEFSLIDQTHFESGNFMLRDTEDRLLMLLTT